MTSDLPEYVQTVLEELHSVRLETVKQAVSPLPAGDTPILICVVKDEIDRLYDFLLHYRGIGVARFCFIDNGSVDGTLEFLQAQPDVDLYVRPGRFNWMLKQGWINKAVEMYGRHRWYLYVDADEHIVFDGLPERSISDLTSEMASRGITRVRGLLVDMYSDTPLLESTYQPHGRLLAHFPFFDRNTYEEATFKEIISVKGGPRRRLFGADDPNFKPELTKYPLFKLAEGELMANPHHIWPYDKNFECARFIAILHFKFLPNIVSKIKKAVQEKTYWNDSYEYRKYAETLDASPDASFMSSATARYSKPQDLVDSGVIQPLHWNASDVAGSMRSRFRTRRADLLSRDAITRFAGRRAPQLTSEG